MSPVPIYLGCAGLIVGSLGLGAQYMLGGSSVSVNAESEQPLFAQSVEAASLPTPHWSSQNLNVAYYEPMVKLLTTPSRSVPPAPATATPQANPPAASQAVPPQVTESAPQEPRAAPREIVRDVPQQTKPSKRTRNARTRDDATASTEQVDPREARAQDQRSRSDRRRVEVEEPRTREREGRVVIREEPEQRIVRGPEQRDVGFSPFRLFGIFDR